MKYNPVPIIRSALDHELSYSLTKPYPRDRWYSSKLKVGALFLGFLIVFATFNLANSAYDLQPRYTSDPNSTESKQNWFNWKGFTFGDDKLNPRCQRLAVSIGTQFMTTNLGLRYTMTAVTSQQNGTEVDFPQVSYLNNALQDCKVETIDIHMEKGDRSAPGGYFWSWQKSRPSVSASCVVHNEDGIFKLFFNARDLRTRHRPLRH